MQRHWKRATLPRVARLAGAAGRAASALRIKLILYSLPLPALL